MKEIPLTQGKVALVDDADYDWLMQWKWHTAFDNGRFYAVRSETYINLIGKRTCRTIKMHRIIMCVTDAKELVDHCNHNTLDNQRLNLRKCTKAENAKNRTSAKDSSSKYLGVSFYFDRHLYRSRIRVNGKYTHLGYYEDEKEAARAYNEAAKKYHGEFANLNVIEEEAKGEPVQLRLL